MRSNKSVDDASSADQESDQAARAVSSDWVIGVTKIVDPFADTLVIDEVSIEARHGVTTGISAADRAKTIQVAVKEDVEPEDIVVPGHVFPLKARAGGVLERAGHTEGSVDIAKLAGLKPAGVICEIMNDDGTMARMPDLEKFSEKHDIPIVTIEDFVVYEGIP